MVVRLFIERHKVDIDIWLYQLRDDGEFGSVRTRVIALSMCDAVCVCARVQVIEAGTGYGTEEAVFAVLQVRAH
jgi:hypothetical protein